MATDEGPAGPPWRIRFDPKISLGAVVSTAALLLSLVAGVVKISQQATEWNDRMTAMAFTLESYHQARDREMSSIYRRLESDSHERERAMDGLTHQLDQIQTRIDLWTRQQRGEAESHPENPIR